ncbi:MAG: hypothetical protein ACR2HA_05535 [Nocardioides sp.]
MDVHTKLAEMRRVIEEARSMPMSASAVVNRTELLALVEELSAAVDSAFSDAKRVVADRESVVDDGRKEADELIAEAKNEREHILSDTEVFRLASREAGQVREHARSESEALRQETDHYVDAKLANFEITLDRTMEAVKRGRERLAGRSVLDSLTDDEVDKITLPEHLDD